MPRPNPIISDPTKYMADGGKRKNPTPEPTTTPPPMPHVLLYSFCSVIEH